MAFKLIWSPDAIEDIESIAQFIEKDSKFYADSVVNKIFEAAQPLVTLPQIGHIVPELHVENIRELIVFQYRIIYEIRSREIHVLTVIHGKRLLREDSV